MQQSQTYCVYVSGASTPDETQRVLRWSERLTAAGITVVSKWPAVIASAGGVANPRDATEEQRRIWSAQDLAEVSRAHALWLMCPPVGTSTRGAWVELGVAHSRAALIVSSGDTRQSIFTALGTECADDAEAFGVIVGVAAARGLL